MTVRSHDAAWAATKAGISLRVRLTPKSSRDAVDGFTDTADGPAFKARVRAVPEDGAANAALEQLIAKWLGAPKSTVSVTAGHKSRVKTLSIAGDTAALDRDITERAARMKTTPAPDRS